MTCTKRCNTLRQPCPTPMTCAETCVRKEPSQPIDVEPSWRDYRILFDLAGAIALIIFAGWLSRFI